MESLWKLERKKNWVKRPLAVVSVVHDEVRGKPRRDEMLMVQRVEVLVEYEKEGIVREMNEEDNLILALQNIRCISKMLRVNFDRLEAQTMMLFKDIEKRKKKKVRGE